MGKNCCCRWVRRVVSSSPRKSLTYVVVSAFIIEIYIYMYVYTTKARPSTYVSLAGRGNRRQNKKKTRPLILKTERPKLPPRVARDSYIDFPRGCYWSFEHTHT